MEILIKFEPAVPVLLTIFLLNPSSLNFVHIFTSGSIYLNTVDIGSRDQDNYKRLFLF